MEAWILKQMPTNIVIHYVPIFLNQILSNVLHKQCHIPHFRMAHAHINMSFEKHVKDMVLQVSHGLDSYVLEIVGLNFITRSILLHQIS